MWGMESVETRLEQLLHDYNPETVILAGDIVDSASADREAIGWLQQLTEKCRNLVLIEGNHDRGQVKEEFSIRSQLPDGRFLLSSRPSGQRTEKRKD